MIVHENIGLKHIQRYVFSHVIK